MVAPKFFDEYHLIDNVHSEIENYEINLKKDAPAKLILTSKPAELAHIFPSNPAIAAFVTHPEASSCRSM